MFRSVSQKNLVEMDFSFDPTVEGKLGSTQYAIAATTTVAIPSKRKSHRHAERPLRPSIPLVIPAEMRPENAPEMRDPEYSRAVLRPKKVNVLDDELVDPEIRHSTYQAPYECTNKKGKRDNLREMF